jgi:hydroxycarboxylate dehydrogenase B
MQKFKADSLKKLVDKLFISMGANEEEAAILADHLVENNLVGHDSHGIIRVLQYHKEAKKGERLKLNAGHTLIKENDGVALIDANLGFGPVSGVKGMQKAIQSAKEYGIGSVTVSNTHHTGRLGAYTSLAAENNMIGMACVNWANESAMAVAPFGGREGRISTNPISFACPSKRDFPFLLDMATSVVAEGKVRVAKNRNEKIPEGWIINKEGKPSTNPEDLYDGEGLGGALLPTGGPQGHKGFALGLVVEILGGILSGNKAMQKGVKQKGQGLFLMAMDIEKYIGINEFKEEMENLFVHIKDTPTIEGFDRIIMPGEIEHDKKQKNLKEGIAIEEKTWQEIVQIAESLKIDIDSIARKLTTA